jgi:hypothetical protein
MSVVRATTATRVNAAGLVEVVPYNLLPYSQNFSNANWVKLNSTILSSNNLAPDGTLTAARLNMPSGSSSQLFNGFPSVAGSYTTSIWVRLVSGSGNFKLGFYDNVTFLTDTITITSTWQRFSVTKTLAAAVGARGCWLYSDETNQVVEVFGGQVVEGTQTKDYQKTETRLNIPRLDYSLGSCPSLLVEPQRTNILLRSQEFDNATWTKTNTSVTANNTTSPDGTANAEKLSATIATVVTPAEIIQSTSQLGSTTYSYSVYAKKSTSNFIALRHTGVSGNPYAWFNLNTGTIGTVQSGITAKIESVGNGWYRCTIVGTTPSVVSVNRVDMIVSDNDANYVCAINGSIFIYGAQLEAGAYATSYIPTTTASVTRNADVISKTGISSLINSEAGVIYYEGSALSNNTSARVIELNESINTLSNNVYFRYEPANNLVAFTVFSGGVLQCNINYTLPLTQKNNYKMAFVWSLNRFEIWVNGSKVAEDTSGIVPVASSLNKIIFYDRNLINYFEGNLKELAIWKTSLTNTQLAQLTTI